MSTMPAIDRDATARRLIDGFLARTTVSRNRHEMAKAVMPGGDTRTVAFHPPYPLTIAEGHGYEMVDVDGNVYIDLLNNYTSLIHGHAHAAINEAVTDQISRGTNFAAAIESQTRLATLLVDRIPSVDKVRFTNSGTEATMNAVRAARAFTGRDLIVKMEGGYHGTYDDFEISVHPALDDAGPVDEPTATFDTRGIPSNTAESVAVVPMNNIPAVEALFGRRGSEIAAVILEPVMGSAGMIPAETAYLQALRDLTTRAGALLIFDEVMSFRLETGGYQQFAGVNPDITTMAKIIGGGFPVGAFGGGDAVMSQFDPTSGKPLWQSGTFNGNAVTTVAGAVAMEHYGADEVARINELGAQLRGGLAEALEERMIPATVTGYGSFAGVHFGVDGVRNYRDAAGSDQDFKRLVHLALLQEGVFAAPRLMFCTSTPMTEATIIDVVGRFGRALDAVRL
ncbi:MAG: aspartate aminotransferase family protein [Thermomicrobiales bacterium]|nr:aspartate aminotransferase family protein [Thermomicrobiales bacterium]